MIAVQEALQYIISHKKSFGTESVELLQANGRILAQHIVADRDFPPFHRATMDGIAISSTAFHAGNRNFEIVDVQPAGYPQKELDNVQCCMEVMTGAVLPANTNAVIRYEDLVITDGVAQVQIEDVKKFQNVHLQGTDELVGNVLVQAGAKVTPAIVAIMASVGLSAVLVYRLPKIAVCSTGDELVDIAHQPQAHQIRQSNNYMLLAALQQHGISAPKYHLPDDPEAMVAQLSVIINHYDAILFSGAVSKGKFDFLPQVLQQLGMQTVFHSIAQKPGKPFLFGHFENGALIFGFPGNPVSTWVCYQLYFKTWLYHSLNIPLPVKKAVLGRNVTFKPLLTHHMLVQLHYDQGKLIAMPVDTSTSGDMVSLIHAKGILSLSAERDFFAKGEVFDVWMF
ncbi:molybdopterin molybdotransferase MoeA [Mucilaginibacter sp. Bleaf8]|uniref:molybdopterin molybdotransferase MoeA n=1 Tax=Mucilaginibacter sp. Bleaf8 TaxID=2834430 RepID=UPI001BCC18D1|nr:molybdopterin molybdotransferase MoeA [Mucilaginibacter sp. Bleaf8]MBS7566233.1 molybdopterin molybdotransferase MoeA [Mucilaginibacter sp. Bleaf8]